VPKREKSPPCSDDDDTIDPVSTHSISLGVDVCADDAIALGPLALHSLLYDALQTKAKPIANPFVDTVDIAMSIKRGL